jgi:hypothetical protein
MKECPSCDYERKIGSTECPRCGIVYEKYKAPTGQGPTEEKHRKQSPGRLSSLSKKILLLIVGVALCGAAAFMYKHFQASEKRLAAFMEHLSDIKNESPKASDLHPVGTMEHCYENGRKFFLQVLVDYQNYSYLDLSSFYKGEHLGDFGLSGQGPWPYLKTPITEEGRRELLRLLSRAKGLYKKARKMDGNLKGKLVGATSDGIGVTFTSNKDVGDSAEREYIYVSVPDPRKQWEHEELVKAEEYVKALEAGRRVQPPSPLVSFSPLRGFINPYDKRSVVEKRKDLDELKEHLESRRHGYKLYFSSRRGNISELVDLLKRAPHVAADRFYADQQIEQKLR